MVVGAGVQLAARPGGPLAHRVRVIATGHGGRTRAAVAGGGGGGGGGPAARRHLESGPEAAVPIASLTKIMTAYLTLRDHPLAPDAQGPMLTMTRRRPGRSVRRRGARAPTNVPVQPGEVLTERQLLNGLLVHSANNFADVLARWDAGTVPAFVAKMNAAAAALGHDRTPTTPTPVASTRDGGHGRRRVAGHPGGHGHPHLRGRGRRSPRSRCPIAGELTNYVRRSAPTASSA